ncbi:MAG: OB-fold nucleic acid binding domain-containing protein, partial [Firmicutes bacterium]|nr:OB-fold nucleic acid binding domain-containing protein [Bacillota bacterium]
MENTIDLVEQERIRREKLQALKDSGNDPFEIVKFKKSHSAGKILGTFEKVEGKKVSVAGRIVLKRAMGKASFIHILDESGKIQLYVSINDIGEELYARFLDWDLGDIVGATGKVFKTKTGEISVHASQIVLLAKSI